ncbi:MAG: tRNA (5-methylaminomethyl-2-thiouridine)(34)-methyltransferase MnmD [Pseudomonadota bacterium]
MDVEDTAEKVEWGPDRVPLSPRYGDSYYARSDGLAETRHVFLDGNDLTARFAEGGDFQIAELGFGTGLNFCAAALAWQQVAPAGTRLAFTSFEAFPLAPEDMARALARWRQIAIEAGCVVAARRLDAAEAASASMWRAPNILPGVDLCLVIGDARETLPDWTGKADAWFLDGFAPAKNPEMWGDALLAQVYAHTAPGGTFATYSAAGPVRRALGAAGFDVTRRPGFGQKREMLTGRRA